MKNKNKNKIKKKNKNKKSYFFLYCHTYSHFFIFFKQNCENERKKGENNNVNDQKIDQSVLFFICQKEKKIKKNKKIKKK